jgi:hypothetical protein
MKNIFGYKNIFGNDAPILWELRKDEILGDVVDFIVNDKIVKTCDIEDVFQEYINNNFYK